MHALYFKLERVLIKLVNAKFVKLEEKTDNWIYSAIFHIFIFCFGCLRYLPIDGEKPIS